jgi:hypothetical protein
MPDIFYGLAVLACPVGMGAMMWFMAKGMRGKDAKTRDHDTASVEELRAEHRRLGAEIERLESGARDNGRRLSETPR